MRRKREVVKDLLNETIVENFPNLKLGMDIQKQKAQKTPRRLNEKRSSPRHIVVKLSKVTDKERILNKVKEKHQVARKGKPVRITTDFSAETLQARREWDDIFKILKGGGVLPTKSTISSKVSYPLEMREK